MHLDGEMDVRATYCVYSVLNVLQMIPDTTFTSVSSTQQFPLFTNQRITNYIWSCQSQWEGGFGGEPGAEAHGGYTYCAVAALYLFDPTTPGGPSETTTTPGSSTIPTTTTTTTTGDDNIHKLELCRTWLRQRQMCYEGGFSGRINKLVDGCYSFWQGAASVILAQKHYPQQKQRDTFQKRPQENEYSTDNNDTTMDGSKPSIFDENDKDPWISTRQWIAAKGGEVKCRNERLDCDPFNAYMLKRYILICTQDENGGLRDKPSKGRDFYHSCYCLSGLSIAQHFDGQQKSKSIDSGSEEHTRWVHRTHPCYNIRVEYVAFCQTFFRKYPIAHLQEL